MSRRRKLLLWIGVLATLVLSGRLLYRWHYPYGWSHCCKVGLMFELNDYANDHGGAYPSGEPTPEASLSLLYPKYSQPEILRGKTVPLQVVQAILQRGERLGPTTCGWHYVEGLTIHDDEDLALFWDKVGLGHNGERLSNGDRIVWFAGRSMNKERISGAQWVTFLEDQKQLHSHRRMMFVGHTALTVGFASNRLAMPVDVAALIWPLEATRALSVRELLIPIRRQCFGERL